MKNRIALVLAICAVAFVLTPRPSTAGVYTWINTDGLWSETNNWVGGVAPTGADNTDQLIFGDNAGQVYTAVTDIPPGTLNQITLTGPTAGITHTNIGSQIQFAGVAPQLQQNGANNFIIQNDVNLSANTLLTGTGSGIVTISGAITGAGLIKNGGSAVVLSGNNTYSGGTLVTNGTLTVDNATGAGTSGTGSGLVTVNNLGLVNGSGTITGGVTINKGGAVNGSPTIGTGATVSGGHLGGSGNVNGDVTVSNTGSVDGSRTISGAATITSGTLGGSGTITGGVTVNNGGTVNGSVKIQNGATVSGGTLATAGTITGNVAINNAGTVAGANTIVGNVAVGDGTTAGTLAGSGTVTGSVTVNDHGTLSGTRTVGALSINNGGVLSPGNSPGKINAGDTTFAAGGTYQWQINNFSGSAGTNPGWDLLNISGDLDVTATSANPFTIDIASLSGTLPGLAASFNNLHGYFLPIATFSGTLVDPFDASAFLLDSSGFLNPTHMGYWTIVATAHSLDLQFNAVPEPSTVLLWCVGLGLIGSRFYFRRDRHASAR